MSVIYRSLQQLKKEEAARETRQTPQAVAPRMSKLVLRALAYTAVLVLLVGSGLFFIKQEVQQIEIPPPPDLPTAPTAKLQERGAAVEKILEGDISAELARPTRQMDSGIQEPIIKQRLYRPPQEETAKEAVDLTKPTKALETHFAKRARSNEEVLSLQRKLIQSSETGDLSTSKDLLDKMTTEIGRKESATKYKWEGYLALKEKRYADAENYYRRAVGIRPGDFVSNLNLAYALLGQDKRDEAIGIYRALVERYPMNEKVLQLGRILGER
ncbi:tetratricopeptide (TPR) repeat protein [Desulfobaculum xiamenense]|uniref:Tetratricopeptide (TPR) repeat protein n=1 Tax=Desulfobaculum xiamenense TaxID=995050 RepID=A0A846QT89_9BACT|nr:tetratricopeptide repeat protein [Desulfobaculum xiamenense]NJB67859.1 tetratricopeptide (TPR) repeat protein [Desulfobaculum xiamenense]